MELNRSCILNITNHNSLKLGRLYKIKSIENNNIEFEESTDNNQQNFYFYSVPRPAQFCLFIKDSPLVPNLKKEITEFQERTNLKITHVL